MFPRFLEDKTFQLPYEYNNKRYVNVIIAHEMLHFIFYNYLYKKYPKYKKHRYDLKVWDVSEAFNAVIQNSREWIKVFKEKCKPYPEHKKLVRKIREAWAKKRDIDYLLEKILRLSSFSEENLTK